MMPWERNGETKGGAQMLQCIFLGAVSGPGRTAYFNHCTPMFCLQCCEICLEITVGNSELNFFYRFSMLLSTLEKRKKETRQF